MKTTTRPRPTRIAVRNRIRMPRSTAATPAAAAPASGRRRRRSPRTGTRRRPARRASRPMATTITPRRPPTREASEAGEDRRGGGELGERQVPEAGEPAGDGRRVAEHGVELERPAHQDVDAEQPEHQAEHGDERVGQPPAQQALRRARPAAAAEDQKRPSRRSPPTRGTGTARRGRSAAGRPARRERDLDPSAVRGPRPCSGRVRRTIQRTSWAITNNVATRATMSSRQIASALACSIHARRSAAEPPVSERSKRRPSMESGRSTPIRLRIVGGDVDLGHEARPPR